MDCPGLDAGDVFTACVSRIQDSGLKSRMTSIKDEVTAASLQFHDLATNNRLHRFVQQAVIAGLVTTQEMEKVYTQRMAKKNAPGRDTYDLIFNSSPHGRCLLCGHRKVETLDHHLPKSLYPVLAVVPANLIPACNNCNKLKLANAPASQSEEALHPYFDNIEDDKWLHAEVSICAPAALRFYVRSPNNWSQVLSDRVGLHFRTLCLANLYAAEAAEELLNIRHQLESIYAGSGLAGVRAELQARAESASAARLNGWRAVTFESFAVSDWFCGGGFALV